MTDIEGLVDKRLDQIDAWAKSSDTCVKYLCLAASLVVGVYDGTTEQIAKRTNRSVSTVQNWAHAAKLMKELRPKNRARVRELWHELPPSHFWLAWDIQRAGFEAFHYLDKALALGWSGRDMLGEYRAERDEGTAPLQYKRAVVSIVGLAREILAHERNKNKRAALLSLIEMYSEAE
jgi:hypothetical protein